MRAALAELSVDDQAVLELVIIDGLGATAAAKILAVRPAALRMRLAWAARRRFAACVAAQSDAPNLAVQSQPGEPAHDP